jgi:drug/metabolite transporter (DMT)-like permease
MTVSVIPGTLLLLLINLAFGAPLTGYSRRTWLALIAMGLFSQMLGWLAINYAIGHLRAAPVAVTLLGQVVVTALLSIPILGEIPRRHQVIGGIVVLIGIYLSNQRNRGGNNSPSSRYTACAAEKINS